MFKHYLVDFHVTCFPYIYLTFKAFQDRSYVLLCVQMGSQVSPYSLVFSTAALNITNK